MKEYRIIQFGRETEVKETEDMLNKLAKEGYEIIATTNPGNYHPPNIILRRKGYNRDRN